MNPLRVKPFQAGRRLDRTLADLWPQLSRSAWQKLLAGGRVKVNEQVETDGAKLLKTDDLVEAAPPSLPSHAPDVDVIFENPDVIVINKPAGLLTHAKGELLEEWTVAELLRAKIANDDSNRPGIVHRLDRGTSGVMIVAKNPTAKAYLQRQFSTRQAVKTYMAIVAPQLTKASFSVNLPITRDPRRPQRFKVSPQGKSALTDVTVLSSSSKASLVKLQPKTGRTHQLRVHMSDIGHPIVGDGLYGGSSSAQRLFLHASDLTIKLPGGEAMTFSAPLPADFKAGVIQYGLDNNRP